MDSILFRNKYKRNNPKLPFDWGVIPIQKYMECVPSTLLYGVGYLILTKLR